MNPENAEKRGFIDYLLSGLIPLSCMAIFFVITLTEQNKRDRIMASDILPKDDMRPQSTAPLPDGYRLQDDVVVIYP